MYDLLLLEEELVRLENTEKIKWNESRTFYDNIASLAAYICNVPISLVTVIGRTEQTFIGKYGMFDDKTNKEDSICQYTLMLERDQPMIIENTLEHDTFNNNKFVINEPYIRFYCGIPIKTINNYNVGTLCTIDKIDRYDITSDQIKHLQFLAQLVEKTII